MDLGYFVRNRYRNPRKVTKIPLYISHATPRNLQFYWNECRRPLPEDTAERARMGLMLSAQFSISLKTNEKVPLWTCAPQLPNKRHSDLVCQSNGIELDLDTPKEVKRQRGRPRKVCVETAPVTR